VTLFFHKHDTDCKKEQVLFISLIISWLGGLMLISLHYQSGIWIFSFEKSHFESWIQTDRRPTGTCFEIKEVMPSHSYMIAKAIW